jgi:hypothetical protein
MCVLRLPARNLVQPARYPGPHPLLFHNSCTLCTCICNERTPSIPRHGPRFSFFSLNWDSPECKWASGYYVPRLLTTTIADRVSSLRGTTGYSTWGLSFVLT